MTNKPDQDAIETFQDYERFCEVGRRVLPPVAHLFRACGFCKATTSLDDKDGASLLRLSIEDDEILICGVCGSCNTAGASKDPNRAISGAIIKLSQLQEPEHRAQTANLLYAAMHIYATEVGKTQVVRPCHVTSHYGNLNQNRYALVLGAGVPHPIPIPYVWHSSDDHKAIFKADEMDIAIANGTLGKPSVAFII